jgi:RNA polymerase sigma-54 factor
MGQISLSLRQGQQLSLTPRLQQSVKLLQLSAMDCVQELQRAVVQNPFIEDLSQTDTVTDERSSTAYTNNESTDWTEWIAAPQSLSDNLQQQLLLLGLGERDYSICSFIIDALDDDGFLRDSLADLKLTLAGTEPAVGIEELENALRRLQALEPTGIAARSLGECLCLQLQTLPTQISGKSLALQLAAHHLPLLANRRFEQLRTLTQSSPTELQDAVELIRKLDPRPGSKITHFDASAIVPDVSVSKMGSQWQVTINRQMYPRIRVNAKYSDCLKQRRTGNASLSQHLQEARWLVRNLEQRFFTLQRVAQAIVKRQKNFLQYGDLAMRPLTLHEIADELNLHESTVSRATSHKYMATPRGIFAFKKFFSRQLSTNTGGACSATAIRAVLRELIESEDRYNPLSDVQLTQLLDERGMKVARRTVTKYRHGMRLAAVEQRRQH